MEYLTLIEAAKLVQDPLQRGVIEIFPRVSPVLERLPFMPPIKGMAYVYNRESVLPGVAFRGINETYTPDTGVINPVVERLFPFGGITQVDRVLTKTQGNLNDIRAVHDGLKAKAAALLFTKNFFKGDNTTNPKEFDGLEKRLTGSQVINPGLGNFSLACLDAAIDAVQGTPDVIFCNKVCRREISAAVRAAGQTIESITDAFGRQLEAYAGIPIVPVEDDENGDPILGWDEGGASTSIYVVKFGIQEYVCGLQAGPMDVIDLGLQSGIFYQTLIEAIWGLAVFHPKSAARYRHITQSTSVCLSTEETVSSTTTTSSSTTTTTSTSTTTTTA